MSFEDMWHAIGSVGRSTASGGYFRQPWTNAEVEMRVWFRQEAQRRGLDVESDPFGNLVAWWRPEACSDLQEALPGVLTGSHLDSVLDGGAFDGPLGVVSAFAAIDELRQRGFAPKRPVGVAAFTEEEGSRFGLACLGSRLATGAISWQRARELRDAAGVALPDAMEAAGDDPTQAEAGAGSDLLDAVGCYLELHVEQGRDLVDREVAVGLGSGIWPHGRYRFDFTGAANHAGTTRMEDRHDPMFSYAMTVQAAHEQARLGGHRATFGRLEVAPNSTNAVPARVRAWLDARCSSEVGLSELVDVVTRLGLGHATSNGTALEVTPESVSAAVTFDAELLARLGALGQWPAIPTAAGHDAGILAAAGVPAAMLFVRNPTGVSHSPAEHADMADCLAGVGALASALERLAS